MSTCIISQSVRSNGKPVQQLTNMQLSGLSTKDSTINTDNGKLYGTLSYSSPTYTLTLYKDVTKSQSVASATSNALGTLTLSATNSSGLSGTINLQQYSAGDSSIECTCFLSRDSDLPQNNLEGLSDYDDTVGFAPFHLAAFDYLREFVVSRYKSIIFDCDFIDTKNLNGATGGYDFSKVLNWDSLREASAHYAYSRIAERQYIQPDDMWDRRSKESKGIVRAFLSSTELSFDTDSNRVPDKSRAFSVWKIARS